jgi:lipopolysaccharide transport system ATP-binding protein
MSDLAIRVENLGKQYRIGGPQPNYRTIRETLVDGIRGPFRRLASVVRGQSSAAGNGSIWALKDVSFEVRHGDVLGIIGRNGAGKSTLLKILSGITEPTEGRAELRGRIGSLLEVGTGFHPELTGRENVYLNGAILGMTRIEIDRKFDEIVDFAEVEKFLDTPVKHYSSGMYVRLAFAVAAHLEPEVLLVDEVLAVGDAAFQKKCLGKMGQVAEQGRTVLFVSHSMSAVLNLCPRALLLEQGRVLSEGPVQSVVESYGQTLRARKGADIGERQNRRGQGRARFTRVWFENGNRKTVEQAMSGKPLVVALQYESQVQGPLYNCRVSIAVEDALGRALFVCSTDMTQNEPVSLPAVGVVRCCIPQLPLSQGHYGLTLFLEVNRDIQDWLKSAVELDVLDGDYYGTGRQYPDGWRGKSVLVAHKWEPSST